jgi:DNA-directed RNA polymerase subunit L
VPGETFTLGCLVQELLYLSNNVEFASMDIGHPLVPNLSIIFASKTSAPEDLLAAVVKEASALCENVLTSV